MSGHSFPQLKAIDVAFAFRFILSTKEKKRIPTLPSENEIKKRKTGLKNKIKNSHEKRENSLTTREVLHLN